jgi:hypothetical protein
VKGAIARVQPEDAFRGLCRCVLSKGRFDRSGACVRLEQPLYVISR